jgi:hypothetical protein
MLNHSRITTNRKSSASPHLSYPIGVDDSTVSGDHRVVSGVFWSITSREPSRRQTVVLKL